MKKNKPGKRGRTGTGRKIGVIFILVALLPALIYSAFELTSLSSTEKLIQSIYLEQLDAILFSINQYSLDVAQSWSSEVNTLLSTSRPERLYSDTKMFLNKRGAVHGVFYADSSGRITSSFVRTAEEADRRLREFPLSSLRSQSTTIDKLLRYASAGYRKIEPLIVGDSASGQRLLLLFLSSSRSPRQRIAGFSIDAESFLTEVLRSKLAQAAGEEFALAVFNRRNEHIVLSTTPVEVADLKATKDLWLFPGYSIGIQLRGTSVEDLVRARTERNLVLIGFLNILLVGAVWLMYRTLRREMELIRLRGDFVSNVSHELRTPLALIRMFTETLSMKRVQTEEKKQEYYETILHETERLTRLINNILNFSRMEAGKKQYHFEPIAPNEIVNEVMKTYDTHMQHEGFTTSVQLAENLPVIQADREAVAEALINILDNAVKYSAAHKSICVKTGQSNGATFIEVKDHGIGIERRHHKKIFETFYRVSTGLTNNVKGSGLGLSLVSHIVNAHGGTIELESAPGKGSTFRLLFPPAEQQVSEHQG